MPDLDGAVLDAPVLDGLDDQQLDDQGVDDGAGGDGAGDGTGAGDGVSGEVKGDERLIPAWMRNLKQTDPAAFKEAKGIFFGKRSIDEKLKDFDLDGTKSWLEEHGGRESLATTLGEMQGAKAELDGIQAAIQSGDRSIIEQMATSSPEGFAKLAPAVAEKWAQMDPEGWDHAMSGVFNATIQQSGVPMHLERMGLQLEQMKYVLESNPDLARNPALVSAYQSLAGQLQTLKGWTGSFAEKAGKALTRAQGAGPNKVDEREQSLDQREKEMFSQDLGRDVVNFRDPLISKELETYIARRPNDADAKDLAISSVRSKVIERMAGDQDFQKKLNQLCARKDKAGAMRLIQSRETAAIQEIAPKVGRSIFGNVAAKKADATQQGGQQRQQQRQQQQGGKKPMKAADKFDAIWGDA